MKKVLIAFSLLLMVSSAFSQAPVNRDTIILAAHEIIDEMHYCGLATIDEEGQPHIRTMNPFPGIKDDFVVWFVTARTSRKASEIKNNPKVCVYFANNLVAKGYVSLNGTASIIDDKELLVKMKRDYWDGIPGWKEKFVLIKIIPQKIEVINYKHKLNNDPETFKAPSLSF